MREHNRAGLGIYHGDSNYRESIRNEVCDVVKKFVQDGEDGDLKGQDLRNHALLLYQASDKLISELYECYLLKESIGGYICKSDPIVFSDNMVKVFEQMSYQNDHDLKTDKTKIKLDLPEGEPLEFNSYSFMRESSYPLLFLVALLNNAVINGSPDKDSHSVEVKVHPDPKHLTLSNLVWTEDMKVYEPFNKAILNGIGYYYDQMARASSNQTARFSYSCEPIPDKPNFYTFTAKLPRIDK